MGRPGFLRFVVIVGLMVTACGSDAGPPLEPTEPSAATPTPTGARVEAPTATTTAAPITPAPDTAGALRTPEEVALEAAGGRRLGGTVTVVASWRGGERNSFLAMVKSFQDTTGVSILYQETSDLSTTLTRRIEAGRPPDLAGLPGPGQMAELERRGYLVDLAEVLDLAGLEGQYAPIWIDLGTTDGKLVGIFMRAAVKGLIWYNPEVWQARGFNIPETWDEMMNLSRQMAEGGTAPWCIGLESGAASGWPGTDWIENIVLRQAGPTIYDQWYGGQIAWTSPEIRRAWETWGQIVADPAMVFGGPIAAVATNFGKAGDPLFRDPPGCYMYHQASFITDFFVQNNPGARPAEDFNFFSFPQFDSDSSEELEVSGDLFGMFNDTPQARALIKYLATPEAQAIWVGRGAAISPNRKVPLAAYPNAVSRRAAEMLTSVEIVRFDASDLMPAVMNEAFLAALLNYVQDPQTLDNILQNLDSVQEDAYVRKDVGLQYQGG